MRAGIGPHDLTKKQVLKLQKDLFHGTTFKPRPEIGQPADNPEVMGTRFETGTALEDQKRPNPQPTVDEIHTVETPQPTTKPSWNLEDK